MVESTVRGQVYYLKLAKRPLLHPADITKRLADMLGTRIDDFRQNWKEQLGDAPAATFEEFETYLNKVGARKDSEFAYGDNGIAYQMQAFLRASRSHTSAKEILKVSLS